MSTDQSRPALKLNSHVLIQLGSELVTDVEQAILECVKNAYDADSFGCEIKIDTRAKGSLFDEDTAVNLARFCESAENVKATVTSLDEVRKVSSGAASGKTRPPPTPLMVRRRLDYTGTITIEDTGAGLTAEQLKTSWLVVSGSTKRSSEGSPKKTTAKGRTPLGDKGLGRLGTMRLGDILRIETATSADGPLSSVWFRWADCKTADTIDQIPVQLQEVRNTDGFKGTKVTVLGLNDIAEWTRKNRIDEITGSLMRLISPFEATSKFRVVVKLNDVEQSLASLTEEVLNKAIARYDFNWTLNAQTGTPELRMTARFKKSLFTPKRKGAMREKAESSFIPDEGEGFFRFLPKYGRLKRYGPLKVDRRGEWLLTTTATKTWSEIMKGDRASVTDPGPFNGSFFYFDFHNLAGDAVDLDTEVALPTDRRLIKLMSGISILRDGFRIRSQGDWLDLAAGMTIGSTYQMRVNNTVGYFALSGEHNFRLTEKSDREGFVEDSAYRGFMQIAKACKEFANDTQEDVRRGFDAYHKQRVERGSHDIPLSADMSLGMIDRSINAARQAREKASAASDALKGQLEELRIAESNPSTARGVAAKALIATQEAIRVFDDVRNKLALEFRSEDAVRRLRIEIEENREQMASLFESAAIGLSARGLAHELRTHLTEIRLRAAALEKHTGKAANRSDILADIRAIRGACTEIQKAAALIDPMLPRGRARKEQIDLLEFARGYMSARESSLDRLAISGDVRTNGPPAKVRLNRARLNQVLDNLVRNSVYWLRLELARGTAESRKLEKMIVVEVGPSGFVVWDNGPGVDVRYEESLFDIFISGKPDKEPGQGLGLFIVRNLLQSDGCDIALLPERNVHGRRFKFSVNISAASVERPEVR